MHIGQYASYLDILWRFDIKPLDKQVWPFMLYITIIPLSNQASFRPHGKDSVNSTRKRGMVPWEMNKLLHGPRLVYTVQLRYTLILVRYCKIALNHIHSMICMVYQQFSNVIVYSITYDGIRLKTSLRSQTPDASILAKERINKASQKQS